MSVSVFSDLVMIKIVFPELLRFIQLLTQYFLPPLLRVICLCAQFEAVLQHGLKKSRGLALTAAALKQAAGLSSKNEGGANAKLKTLLLPVAHVPLKCK